MAADNRRFMSGGLKCKTQQSSFDFPPERKAAGRWQQS